MKYKTMLWAITVIASLGLNVATVLSANVFDALHGALSYVSPQALLGHGKSAQFNKVKLNNAQLKKQLKLKKHNMVQVKRISGRISKRVVKGVVRNTSSIMGEAVPYVGIGVMLAVTAADVYDGCQTVKDLNQMTALIDVNHQAVDEATVCGIEVPTVDDVKQQINQLLF
ncbi:hypothetical protein ACFOD0_16620 [Shewanella intestini]|uniref:Uncharacterized protein n=1 Tax=Shewanella intestini TaxID=2017544 RepID=A0ABS5I4G1_9GAMM|nr:MULTISPECIES: hypothetical protein [Shewanella]MBR9728912.1 hypothetical protein [Shewanella intestini]MRG37022.1 hypothetical protein [Shewanella sp. XMDDZSB0408]